MKPEILDQEDIKTLNLISQQLYDFIMNVKILEISEQHFDSVFTGATLIVKMLVSKYTDLGQVKTFFF